MSPPYDQVDEGANASWFQALRNSDVTAAGGRSASRLRGLVDGRGVTRTL